MRIQAIALVTCAALAFAGCAQYAPIPETNGSGSKSLREARSRSHSTQERAALYLQAAEEAAPQAGTKNGPTAARDTYNAAAAELTVLLRSADQGQMWNHPDTLATSGASYHLRFQPGGKLGIWAPNFFTSFVPARDVPMKSLKRPDRQEGIGGALVGVRKTTPREPFAPRVGVTAPVTATLDFHGHDATLALRDPSAQPTATVNGAVRPLDADFSAPLAYYPSVNELIAGLMGAINVSGHMDQTGIYMLQPYDPKRIPLIFVHGLVSTARMWRNVANEIETDPVLREHYQCWAFNYPTGYPVLYSALRFREELAKVEQVYPGHRPFVFVSHSMGGMVSRLQVTKFDLAAWERGVGAHAASVLASLPAENLVRRATIFDANPRVHRIVFICTPHRGSQMATSSIGEIAARLIALPSTLATAARNSLGNALTSVTGAKSLPNSIYSLSPKNPTLKIMDKLPIQAPHHSIIGDRGKGDTPNSSDGVVPYWSSHLDTAKSEKIVPGPHGSCELPETIAELKRILNLELKTAGN